MVKINFDVKINYLNNGLEVLTIKRLRRKRYKSLYRTYVI